LTINEDENMEEFLVEIESSNKLEEHLIAQFNENRSMTSHKPST